jgi:hypothetical protein
VTSALPAHPNGIAASSMTASGRALRGIQWRLLARSLPDWRVPPGVGPSAACGGRQLLGSHSRDKFSFLHYSGNFSLCNNAL